MSTSPSVVLLCGVHSPNRESLAALAARRGLRLVDSAGGIAAWSDEFNPALCVTGAPEDDSERYERILALRKALHVTPLVVLSKRLRTDSVVRLLRMGVADVIELPAAPEKVAAACFEHLRPSPDLQWIDTLAGESEALLALRDRVERVAQTESTVLLTGETGTGKGLVARVLHQLSTRRRHPFVHVDCASLSTTVIESELFGHERGAFTGASARRPGRFELARDGTVFLDEIADLTPDLQGKLLRVLQDREYERIGGTTTLRMTARIIAATNQDLRSAIRESRFRADLYYRLNVFHLVMPTLRERIEDIPVLVQSALRRLGVRLEGAIPRVSDSFLARLMAHDWPGNVRELINVLECVLTQHSGEVLEARDLDGVLEATPLTDVWNETPLVASNGAPRDDDQESAERVLIAATLVKVGGNVARAARRLRIPRSTLRYRIRKNGLSDLIPVD
jgi:DNA-binding NtrC family response regulator